MLSIRLSSHLLTPHVHTQVSDIVRHYGCVQAQDVPQAMRVIGSRVHGSIIQDVKNACTAGEIIRTRPMRGTLHYMAPENVHWMLDLCASKTLPGFAKRREFLGISDKHADRALEIIESSLRGGKALTRTALGESLKAGGIPMQTQWVYHLTCYAATRKLICFGPPTDKEETFVLLDERVHAGSKATPSIKQLTHDEQLATLATMYIRSHGPVTVDDLARWAGLRKGDCKQAFSLVAGRCEVIQQSGKTYYYMPTTHMPSADTEKPVKKGASAHIASSEHGFPKLRLLGGFDEYFIGYKDRTPVADMVHHGQLFTKNGIFFPLIVLDGMVVGTWKRTRIKTTKRNAMAISRKLLPGVHLLEEQLIQETQRYAQFRGVEEVVLEALVQGTGYGLI